MNSISILGVLLPILFLQIACSNERVNLERPESVPLDAVSAIGPDGGAWAKCHYIETMHAKCNLFFSTGEIWVRGNYLLKVEDALVEIRSADELKVLMNGFSLFDGQVIYLTEGKKLIPDGVIDSPFSTGGGKRTEYSKGEVVQPEVQYD